MNKTLIIGIGNSGRQDDGLGWAFLDAIENLIPENIDLEYRYQLQVEDAELISHYDKIVFVDADLVQYPEGFNFKTLMPNPLNSYTSHELSPENILELCHTIYQKFPECFILGISGKAFHLSIGMTEEAHENLLNSIHFFIDEQLKIVTTF